MTQPINLNDTTPAAPAGGLNLKFQADAPSLDPAVARRVSVYVPADTYVTPAKEQASTYVYFADSGTANAYAITAVPAIAAYAAGQRFVFKAANANTTAATLNVNGLGTKSITKNGTTPLVANDILAGQVISVVYDGTEFQMISPGGSGGGGSSTLASGTPIIAGAAKPMAAALSSVNNWTNFSLVARMSGAQLSYLATAFKIVFCFTAGTAAKIGGCKILKVNKATTAVLSSTNVTFAGGSAFPYTNTFGVTASTTAPVFMTSDSVSLALDADHDYYITMFFTNDSVPNSTVGLAGMTVAGDQGHIMFGFVSGDQTGVSTIPNTTEQGGGAVWAVVVA